MNLPDGWTTNTARVNGVELRYYRTGDGPTLVLAHGFYSNGRCWERLAADLADEYELVMYDARGHGRSDAPESGYGIEDRVADLVGLVGALSLDDPILVGHSMGGSTAAWTAATHPDLPRAVVLEDPAGVHGPPDTGPDERARMVRENVREWSNRSLEALVADHDDREPALARRLAVANAECRPEIAEITREGYPPLADAFPDIECPTLVLKADADPATRAADLDLADELTDGRLVHVPDAGHCVLRDEYEAAYAELRTFLRRLSFDADY
ncbi:alpha/beta hydrolase fold protein [Haladaptatus paucihalophilus DX253]|uniref:Alpha/beta hydrolase fold protein n=1 Tax=Haladaptatus paucihalophilus DX253 TaxID=797209 RepID=E7QPJ1_HALPU|nr:alpha/beta hydrolase [Haladaptatus paucihalophilus]EFW93474.1 alpha/beta hydrolase fold protein [Haladaptatus paucihalophilus DX253]SHL20109.1 Pimeloyl-ACP methyl ester carboxylesterase [Haladaptatus paucihalophilus DX253]